MKLSLMEPTESIRSSLLRGRVLGLDCHSSIGDTGGSMSPGSTMIRPSFLTDLATTATAASLIPPPTNNKPSALLTASTLSIDDIISDDLAQTSSEEQQRIFQEIHGVTPSTMMMTKDRTSSPPSPSEGQSPRTAKGAAASTATDAGSINDTYLQQLEEEIMKIRPKRAYDKAVFLSPKRVKDPEFRLLFLRADQYNVKRAAVRITKHFESKVQLFGPDKIVQDITLDDLKESSQETWNVFHSGAFQLLPCKDRSGRPVFFHATKHAKCSMDLYRVMWYHFMVALEHTTTHPRGAVGIRYDVGTVLVDPIKPKIVSSNMHQDGEEECPPPNLVLDSIPLKFDAFHWCCDDKHVQVDTNFLMTFSRSLRLRTRFHSGTDMECIYALEPYGIASGILPVSCQGRYQNDDFIRFIEQRQRKEEIRERKRTSSETDQMEIVAPSKSDVLLGKGRSYHCEHSGNVRFNQLIDYYYDMHKSSTDEQKTVISLSIVQMIKESNGRFLKMDKNSDVWTEQADVVSRKKVAHAFRAKSEKLCRKQQQQQQHQFRNV